MGTLRTYTFGFALSVVFTLAAFWLVGNTPILIVLAIMQLLVQLVLFLHVGQERKLWNVAALVFAVLIVTILVGGTLWIMYNLSHGQMSYDQNLLQSD